MADETIFDVPVTDSGYSLSGKKLMVHDLLQPENTSTKLFDAGLLATQAWVGAQGFTTEGFDPSENETITGNWLFTGDFSVSDGVSGTGFWTDTENNVTWTGDWQGVGNNTTINVDDNDKIVEINAENGINTNSIQNIGGNWVVQDTGEIDCAADLYLAYNLRSGLQASDYTTQLGDWAGNGNNTTFDVDDEAQEVSTTASLNLLNGGRSGITTPNYYQTRVGTPNGYNGTFLQVDDNAENIQIWCYDWDEDNANVSFNGNGSGVLAYSNISWDRPGNLTANSYADATGAMASQFWVNEQGFQYSFFPATQAVDLWGGGINTNSSSDIWGTDNSWYITGDGIGKVSFDNGAISSNGSGNLTAYLFTVDSDIDNTTAILSTTSLSFNYSDDSGGLIATSYSNNSVSISNTDDYGDNSYANLTYAGVSGGYDAEGSAVSQWYIGYGGISLANYGALFFEIDGSGNINANSITAQNASTFESDTYMNGWLHIGEGNGINTTSDINIQEGGNLNLIDGGSIVGSNYGSTTWQINPIGAVWFDAGEIQSDGSGNISAISFNIDGSSEGLSNTFINVYAISTPSLFITGEEGNGITVAPGMVNSFDGGVFTSDGSGNVSVNSINAGFYSRSGFYNDGDTYSAFGDVQNNGNGTTIKISDDDSGGTIYASSTIFNFLNSKLVSNSIGGLNFVNDAAAATGGVPIGGVYNTAGVLKIRLS